MRQLFLIGPMGVGKTTIGKKVAKHLGVEFRDTDKLIIAKHGPISDIFHDYGEDYFRKLETQELLSLADFEGVVATGGGIVLAEENQKFLSERTVIYLSTSGKQMKTRLLSSKKRPLLKNGYKDWVAIYESRKSIYQKVSSLEISIDGKPLSQVADRCVDVYRSIDA